MSGIASEIGAAISSASAPTGKAGPLSAFSQLFRVRLTFTQGFLAGQLSVIVIALLVIRFVIFEDSGKASAKQQDVRSPKSRAALPIRQIRGRGKSTSVFGKSMGSAIDGSKLQGAGARIQPNVATVMVDILNKVHYEIESHGSESIDWLTIVVAQALAGYRQDVLAGGWSAEQLLSDAPGQSRHRHQSSADDSTHSVEERTARDWMEEILNARTVGRGMSFLDPIQVTHVDFGDSYPIFSNAKIRPADDMGRMRVEVDVDYSDCVSLAIETKLLINVPRPRFAVLPISLGFTVERFSGTLAIELFSSTTSTILPQSQLGASPKSRHELHFSLHPDFALDASATSLVGSRAKLQDVPKIEQILVGRVRSFIHDRFVWPKYWSLTLPNLVPRDIEKAPSTLAAPAATGENGRIDVAGQGDAAKEVLHTGHTERQANGEQTDPFFATAPPLFPGVFYEGGGRPSSSAGGRPVNGAPAGAGAVSAVPGSLPAVEAWRSQAAAHAAQSSLRHRGSSHYMRSPSLGAPAAQAPGRA